MRRTAAVVSAVTALGFGLAACTSDDPLDSSPGPIASASPAPWRWESFGNAEISVPEDWGYGTGDVASALWCISDAGVGQPTVLRPGVEVESTCPGGPADGPDPATTVAKAGAFVSFVYAASDPGVRLGVEGDRSTLRVGSVLIRVQAPSAQRQAILATARQISVDAHGCPTSDPISTLPTRRPGSPVAVGELDDVRSVTACRYAIPGGKFAAPAGGDATDGSDGSDGSGVPAEDGSGADGSTLGPAEAAVSSRASAEPTGLATDDPSGLATDDPSGLATDDPSGLATDDPAAVEGADSPADLTAVAPLLPTSVPAGFPTLLSSVELDGDEARAAVRGIADAPRGVGPEADNGCADPFVRGTEAIVLRVARASGEVEIYLRYGGCRNGFDDGVAERMLSRDTVAPFVAGANSVPVFGEELVRILDDPNAPATSGDPADSGESPPPGADVTG